MVETHHVSEAEALAKLQPEVEEAIQQMGDTITYTF